MTINTDLNKGDTAFFIQNNTVMKGEVVKIQIQIEKEPEITYWIRVKKKTIQDFKSSINNNFDDYTKKEDSVAKTQEALFDKIKIREPQNQ
jgi:hypothetical protein